MNSSLPEKPKTITLGEHQCFDDLDRQTMKSKNNKPFKEQILDCLKNFDWRVSLEDPNVLLSEFPEEYEKVLGDLVFHDRFFAVGSRVGSPEIRWLPDNSIYLRAYRSSNEITIEEVLDDFKELVKDLGLKIDYSEYERAVELAESSLKKVRELYGENV